MPDTIPATTAFQHLGTIAFIVGIFFVGVGIMTALDQWRRPKAQRRPKS